MSLDAARSPTDAANTLPVGTRLYEYEINGLLGIGGFGIVYLAFDHALEREVAIKEYMPAMMAGRTETMHVSLRSQSDAETFALGLRSFVNEAKLLARFDHPALLKVYRFWESNGTAYMAMPVLRGRTLKQIRNTLADPPDEAWLRAVLDPLLGAIEHLHQAGVYHRDIAPDNIQIEPDGHPVLVDFGAARRVITDKTQTLTAILKPSYAPIEQYADSASVKQGPWTDLYALGATLHYMLLGKPPSPATTRAVIDDVAPLAQMALPGCRPEFLAAIDWMLNPRPVDRPQSVAALREVLDGMSPLPAQAVNAAAMAQAAASVAPAAWDRTLISGRGNPGTATGVQQTDIDLPMGSRVTPPAAGGAAAGTAVAASESAAAADLPLEPTAADPEATLLMPRVAPVATPPAPVPPVVPAAGAAPTSRSWAPWAGAGLGLVALLAWLFWPKSGVDSNMAAPTVAASAALSGASASTAGGLPVGAASTAAGGAPASAAPSAAVRPASPDSATGSSSRDTVAARPTPGQRPGTAAEIPPSGSTAVTPARPPGATAPTAATTSAPAAATAPPAIVPAANAALPSPAPAPAAAAPVATSPVAPATTHSLPAPAPEATRPTAVAEPAKPAAAIGPEAKCDGRNPVLYFVCMERECLRPGNQDHPDCRKWRASKPAESR